ncbi:uncharacterized protein NDAI_0I03140 [Naumovozyma dairenensis CBS 421]|uniref:Uncharacterized protein n=1 Tax=Naumovozyma dairenensis (strain ATCC 10597 / BCRC 20456 / CBS 421 / NBRC 0211 / NRRL Y-12639) TaxID=1071378 RepID=G0WGH1_NAUDC|nr:hypothetical protein NDAI_0I03140 [Naumovozyma dairenensis CBS 421]CCD26882.1 hypothetical protein NDAI_0I03140 [Naumovozyma dairenensis CBS 421]
MLTKIKNWFQGSPKSDNMVNSDIIPIEDFKVDEENISVDCISKNLENDGTHEDTTEIPKTKRYLNISTQTMKMLIEHKYTSIAIWVLYGMLLVQFIIWLVYWLRIEPDSIKRKIDKNDMAFILSDIPDSKVNYHLYIDEYRNRMTSQST